MSWRDYHHIPPDQNAPEVPSGHFCSLLYHTYRETVHRQSVHSRFVIFRYETTHILSPLPRNAERSVISYLQYHSYSINMITEIYWCCIIIYYVTSVEKWSIICECTPDLWSFEMRNSSLIRQIYIWSGSPISFCPWTKYSYTRNIRYMRKSRLNTINFLVW